MSTLVIAEHDNNRLHTVTKNTITAAIELAAPVTLLIVGYACNSVADEASILSGVSNVLVLDHVNYQHPVAEQLVAIVMHVVQRRVVYSAILAPATTFGKNFLPGIAALLDVAEISDVTKIINKNTFEHPIYAGNAIELVTSLDAIQILTIRTTAFNALEDVQSACVVERLDQSMVAMATDVKTHFVSQNYSVSTRPDLSCAKIVVSGGRGLQSQENFKLIEQLADELGAAVGASRAAVDAGFVANEHQVGQTGKVIAPELYIAIGISGAIQHLAGMKDSKIIIAINKDADAPIMQIADYYFVGDLFVILPEIINKLKQFKRKLK